MSGADANIPESVQELIEDFHAVPDADRLQLSLDETVTEQDLDTLSRQLGRPVRDVVEIGARCVCGNPLVATTAPRLSNGIPFPTTFYLTHPVLTAAVSRVEADGEMARMNERLEQDAELAAAHRRHRVDVVDVTVGEEHRRRLEPVGDEHLSQGVLHPDARVDDEALLPRRVGDDVAVGPEGVGHDAAHEHGPRLTSGGPGGR